MGLREGLLGCVPAGELERRERPEQLRMEVLDVVIDLEIERLFVLCLENLPTTALDDGCHPGDKTG
jgi:hypothetical protein